MVWWECAAPGSRTCEEPPSLVASRVSTRATASRGSPVRPTPWRRMSNSTASGRRWPPSGSVSSSSAMTSPQASCSRHGSSPLRERLRRWRHWSFALARSRPSLPVRWPFGSTVPRTWRSPAAWIPPTSLALPTIERSHRTRGPMKASTADCAGTREATSPRWASPTRHRSKATQVRSERPKRATNGAGSRRPTICAPVPAAATPCAC